jgi:hypothetical protein
MAPRVLRLSLEGRTLSVHTTEHLASDVALAAARELAVAQRSARGPAPRPDGTQAWLKAATLSPSGARRHGRARLVGRMAPHVRERAHLGWLEARLFRAPRPLFAATLTRGAQLVYQVLATAPVADAVPFDEANAVALDDTDSGAWRSAALARELGGELARMHALGFLHGDVYPRNVLVAPPEFGATTDRRLVWVDCWAGGTSHGDRSINRPLARDLGTWFATAATAWRAEEAAACFGAYFDARRANGRPVRAPARFLARVALERRRELRRLEREPKRLRGAPFPLAGWESDFTPRDEAL